MNILCRMRTFRAMIWISGVQIQGFYKNREDWSNISAIQGYKLLTSKLEPPFL